MEFIIPHLVPHPPFMGLDHPQILPLHPPAQPVHPPAQPIHPLAHTTGPDACSAVAGTKLCDINGSVTVGTKLWNVCAKVTVHHASMTSTVPGSGTHETSVHGSGAPGTSIHGLWTPGTSVPDHNSMSIVHYNGIQGFHDSVPMIRDTGVIGIHNLLPGTPGTESVSYFMPMMYE
jgi:hypothetical protein